jgi:crossover junction endodeoxyribonuclease RuvC
LQKPDKIILGIDPGTIVMGYGLITIKGNQASLLELGVLKPGNVKDSYKKLQLIFNTVSGLITKYEPSDFAIEAPFFGKNVQSMLKLGRAQGVAIAAAMRHGLDVTEYSPKKVKQSITGNGNADKEQVMKMLQTILSFKESPKHYDATDALAVALCHHFQTNSVLGNATKGLKGWEDFLKKNPDRVVKVKSKKGSFGLGIDFSFAKI